jgi:hypothetical protein
MMERIQQAFYLICDFLWEGHGKFLLAALFISVSFFLAYYFYLQPLLRNKQLVAQEIRNFKIQLVEKNNALVNYSAALDKYQFSNCRFIFRAAEENTKITVNNVIGLQISTILVCPREPIKRDVYLLITNYYTDFLSYTPEFLPFHTRFYLENSLFVKKNILTEYPCTQLQMLGFLSSKLTKKTWGIIKLPDNNIHTVELHDKIGLEKAGVLHIDSQKIVAQDNINKKTIELFVKGKES